MRKRRHKISKRIRNEVFQKDNFACHWCRVQNEPLTVDHLLPVSLGGTDYPVNLVAACKVCNARRGNRRL